VHVWVDTGVPVVSGVLTVTLIKKRALVKDGIGKGGNQGRAFTDQGLSNVEVGLRKG